MNACAIIVSFSALGFIEPTLCVFVQGYGVTDVGCGLVFTLPTVVYALSVGVVNRLSKKLDRGVLVLSGLSLVSLGLLLLGPWSYSFLPKTLYTTLCGTAAVGCGLAFTMLPCMPDMLEEATEALPFLGKDQLSDKLSGIITTAFYIGKSIGPPLGGYLSDQVGFSTANAWYALGVVGFAGLYGRFVSTSRRPEELQEKSSLILVASF